MHSRTTQLVPGQWEQHYRRLELKDSVNSRGQSLYEAARRVSRRAVRLHSIRSSLVCVIIGCSPRKHTTLTRDKDINCYIRAQSATFNHPFQRSSCFTFGNQSNKRSGHVKKQPCVPTGALPKPQIKNDAQVGRHHADDEALQLVVQGVCRKWGGGGG